MSASTNRNLFGPDELPLSTNVGLLVLRLWVGLSMLILHGWDKVFSFNTVVTRFPDALGVGSPAANLALSAFAEFVAALLIALGFGTRAAALVLVVNMAVAFFVAHGARLSGPGSGETAFLYLAAFVVLVLSGPGRFSVDAAWFGTKRRQ